jgi:hypothetical protein
MHQYNKFLIKQSFDFKQKSRRKLNYVFEFMYNEQGKEKENSPINNKSNAFLTSKCP